MKRKIFLSGAIALAVGLASGSASAQEVSLRAVSFVPKNHPVMAQGNVWVDTINEKLAGKVKINYVGGPEVIGRHQQLNALRSGILDVLMSVTSDFQDEIPEVSAFTLSKLGPEAERTSGFYDLMVKTHERVNVRYLGRVQYGGFYLWTKKKPETLADLKGLKMRTGSLYDKMMRELGMVPVSINQPETYTALEQGTVDGLGWPVFGVRSIGWTRHVKFAIDLPFYETSNMIAVMNLDKWNKLPAEVQKAVLDATAQYEPKMVAFFKEGEAKEWVELDKVVTRVKFSEAENKKYLDTAYDVEWAAIAKRVSPDTLAQLRKATGN
ncbi:MAG: TRAP transporter substrate-binding protein DctP [Rhodospirillales bacterium]|nr:TRAP transporter substrate-binding protein DctP [Rhodospirillales bacterium]